jgi:putative SOS response-associated peptidase YedK
MGDGKSLLDSEPDGGKPGLLGLVLRINPETGERSFDHLTWGLVPHDTANLTMAPRPVWARAESVATHPLFADAFHSRRVAVLANEYYQRSTRQSPGKRFALRRVDGLAMAWAGLWEGYRAPDGEIIRSYCVITVEASSDVEPIHDRMPLVLNDADLPVWLGEEQGDPGAYCVRHPLVSCG